MSEHTKGPWRIDRRDETWEIVGKLEKATRFGKKGEWTVCSIDADDLPKPVMKANAKLIAAAPDLLEALQAMCANTVKLYAAIAHGNEDAGQNFANNDPQYVAAVTAIARVKGSNQ